MFDLIFKITFCDVIIAVEASWSRSSEIIVAFNFYCCFKIHKLWSTNEEFYQTKFDWDPIAKIGKIPFCLSKISGKDERNFSSFKKIVYFKFFSSQKMPNLAYSLCHVGSDYNFWLVKAMKIHKRIRLKTNRYFKIF